MKSIPPSSVMSIVQTTHVFLILKLPKILMLFLGSNVYFRGWWIGDIAEQCDHVGQGQSILAACYWCKNKPVLELK